jgi:hypothetical protein
MMLQQRADLPHTAFYLFQWTPSVLSDMMSGPSQMRSCKQCMHRQ